MTAKRNEKEKDAIDQMLDRIDFHGMNLPIKTDYYVKLQSAFMSRRNRILPHVYAKEYPNITVKKIPQMLLEKCEFGKTGYNLNIVHPPVYEENEDS